jgi:hypothetical protein
MKPTAVDAVLIRIALPTGNHTPTGTLASVTTLPPTFSYTTEPATSVTMNQPKSVLTVSDGTTFAEVVILIIAAPPVVVVYSIRSLHWCWLLMLS